MENDLIRNYLNRLRGYIDLIDAKELLIAANAIRTAIGDGKNIFTAGNGGSLATAMHFAEDILMGNKLKTRVYHLANQSCLTAISNDDDYKNVFVTQLKNLMDTGDLLVTISCSGNSMNLVSAIEYANEKGYTLGISGFDGGFVRSLSNYKIYVKTKIGDYETTEDVHQIICHILSCMVKKDEV